MDLGMARELLTYNQAAQHSFVRSLVPADPRRLEP
jgi:hypothetical protein